MHGYVAWVGYDDRPVEPNAWGETPMQAAIGFASHRARRDFAISTHEVRKVYTVHLDDGEGKTYHFDVPIHVVVDVEGAREVSS